MSGWNYQEYLNGQIEKIKKLQASGYTTRDILDKNVFCFEALKACGLPLSYLVPRADGAELNVQEWDTHSSNEHKWGLWNGVPFTCEDERDRVLIGLLYSSGFKHLLEILPVESRNELVTLVKNLK